MAIWLMVISALLSPDGGGPVSLTVLGDSEVPGISAAVVWQCWDDAEVKHSGRLKTDDSGGAEISLPGAIIECSIWAVAPGLGLGRAEVRSSWAAQEVLLRLGPEAGIRIRTVDGIDESPVRQDLDWTFTWRSGEDSAEVALPTELLAIEADEKGFWTVRGLPVDPHGRLSVKFGGDGWSTEHILELVLDRPGVHDLGVRPLARQSSLCGRVAGLEEGEAAAVLFRSAQGTVIRRPTLPDGSFCLDGMPAGRPVGIWAVAPGPRESALVEVVPPGANVVLAVPPARVLRGVVRDANTWEPVTRFEIVLQIRVPQGADASPMVIHRSQIENEEGSFSFPLPPDQVLAFVPLILVVSATGRPKTGIELEDLRPEEEVVVELGEYRELTGRVERIGDGTALPGAAVAVRCGLGNEGDLAEVNLDGFFLLKGVPPEACILEASHPGYVTERLSVADGDESMDVGAIQLTQGQELQGQARSANDGRPVPGVLVAAIAGSERRWVTETNADGRFSLKDLPGERMLVTAEKEGFRRSATEVDLRSPGHGEIAFTLEKGVVLQGHVHGLGDGGSNASVHFFGETGEMIETLTAHGGRFSVSGVPTGSVRFAVRHYSLQNLCTGSFVVAPGASVWSEDLECESTGFSVDGVLTDPGGVPVGGAILQLIPSRGGGRSALDQTDANGRFEFRDVAPGTYEVVLVVPGERRSTIWQGDLLRQSSLRLVGHVE